MKVRLFHPTDAAKRLAVVSIQPLGEGRVGVTLSRGPARAAMTDSQLFGPFPEAEAHAWLSAVVEELQAGGYLSGGAGAMLEALNSDSPRARAHAAIRLGARRERSAVDALRAKAASPRAEVSAAVLALGWIGDAAAVPEVEAEASKKLLSRRRAGAEALRFLADPAAVERARARARERLAADGLTADDADGLHQQLVALPSSKRGPALDALYDLGTEPAVAEVRRAFADPALPATQPGTWRYTKSVLKRAMARFDAGTFALLVQLVERQGRQAGAGTRATVKSGLDGQSREVRVFSRRTADWLRRAAWRHLTLIGRHRPERFVDHAAAVLAAARSADDLPPKGDVPAAGHNYLLMRLLTAGGSAFRVDSKRPTHRRVGAPRPFAAAEAFPELWASPAGAAGLRAILVHGDHGLALAFAAARAAQRPEVLAGASAAELVAILRHPALRAAASERLRARLSAQPLDVGALQALALSDDPAARELAGAVVTDTAHLWVRQPAVGIALLAGPPALREAAARLIRAAAPHLPRAARDELAARLVDALDADPPEEGAFDGFVEVIDLFEPEVLAQLDVDRARRLLARSPEGAVVAAMTLGRLPDAMVRLGEPAVLALAADPAAARRSVVVAMLRHHPEPFVRAFGLLLELLEGEWDDVRAAGLAVVRSMADTLAPAGGPADVDRVLAVIDSTWPAVQAEGQQLVRRALAGAPDPALSDRLLASLAQHPHASMRSFVLDLAEGALGAGAPRTLDGLRALIPLLRAALFDVRPRVALRRRAVAFVVERGRADPDQAELAVALLLDVARSCTHTLRDDALAGIAALAVAHPSAQSRAAAGGVVVGGAA